MILQTLVEKQTGCAGGRAATVVHRALIVSTIDGNHYFSSRVKVSWGNSFNASSV